MFELALKATLPFVGVHTDDPVNVREVLQSIAKSAYSPARKLDKLPNATAATVGDHYLYWTEDSKQVNTDNYRKLCASAVSCVVINGEASTLVFDAGILPTPTHFYTDYLTDFMEPAAMGAVVQVLKGLSPKSAQEVVQLTMARTGSILPNEVRKTRQMLGGSHPGLYALDTAYDFYEWPKELKDWVELNHKYFLDPSVPDKLRPRGLFLKGKPGVGKSMFAMVLANFLDIPLYRLDVSTSLNRYLGESESRIARNLSIIEQNAPCVWLLDEVEKLFGVGGDEGTTTRILSQILWWLQYHRAPVFTVMTCNNPEAVPKELYRPERVDRVVDVPPLSLNDAKLFSAKVYQSVLGDIPMKRQKQLREAVDKMNKSTFAHAEIRVMVYEMIKAKDWLKEDK